MGAFSSAFSPAAFSVAVVAPPADVIAPEWPSGAQITLTGVTSTGCTASWPAATDASGAVSYRWRIGAGAWVTTLSTSADIAGQADGSAFALEVQALDSALNYSESLTRSVQLAAPEAPSAPHVAWSTITAAKHRAASQPQKWEPKYPEESVLLGFDFAPDTGAPLSPVVTCARYSGKPDANASGLLIGAPAVVGGMVLQRVAGGVPGCTYSLHCRVATAAGDVFVLAGLLSVIDAP